MLRAVLFLSMFTLVLTAIGAEPQERQDPPPPLGTASFNPPEANTKVQPLTPENFVVRAAVSNMAEIEASQLALQRSADPAIRKFATQLIKDHQAAQARLKAFASKAKIALPGTVDEEHRKQKQQLAELVGAEFDRRYLAMMHTGHERTVKLLETAGSSTELDPTLKTYANETLATVKSHRMEAHELVTSDR